MFIRSEPFNIVLIFYSMLQFFLRLGCKDSPPSTGTPPVYVQYSIDGGITWTTFEQFDFSSESNQPEYIALHLPEKARMNSTQLQWWQPSIDGTFPEEWAIDQVCICLYLMFSHSFIFYQTHKSYN